MSGLEVQEHLLARKAELPIIFITGHGDVSMAVNALKRGAVDFIEKPFEQAALSSSSSACSAKPVNATWRRNAAVSMKPCSDDLGISIKTVEAHRASIMDKTNSGTVADLMRVVMGTKLLH